MRVVLQRVSRAAVTVGEKVTGSIARGHVLLVGFEAGDGDEEIDWMARKVVELRVFEDGEGKMNLSLEAVGGELLVVSQFTLYGDVRKGRRPSFVRAAAPEVARPLYEDFLQALEDRVPGRVRSGEFGAMMDVELVNDGPVTLLLER